MLGFSKRERILVAGVKLFSTRGLENTTLAAIQASAGVAVNTFYKYFRDKEQLANEIYRGVSESLETTLNLATIDGEGPRAQFHGLWVRMAAFHEEYPQVIAFLESQRLEAYLDADSRALPRIPQPITDLIDRLHQEKMAKDAPAVILAAIVWGSFVELVKLRSLEHLSLSEEDLRAAEECTWNAIRTMGDGKPDVGVHPVCAEG